MSKKQRFFRFLSKKLTFSKCFGYIIRKETAEVYSFSGFVRRIYGYYAFSVVFANAKGSQLIIA